MATIAQPAARVPTAQPARVGVPSGQAILFALVFALVAFVVLYPILLLVFNSFQVGRFGQTMTWGLDNWRDALVEPKMRESIFNTLSLTATRQGIAFGIG